MAGLTSPTFPSIQVSIAPGVGAKTAPDPLDWFDLTRARDFDLTRGRADDAATYDAGRLTVTLSNATRELDPLYSAGAYFGDLKPMLPIRLIAAYNTLPIATVATLFVGFIEGFPQTWQGQKDAVVTLTAIDGFSVLAAASLPGSVWEYTIRSGGPSAWFRLGESLGTVAGDSSGNRNDGTYNATITAAQQGIVPYAGDNGSLQFDGIDDYLTAPITVLDTSDTTCSVEFWMKSSMVPLSGGALLVKVMAPGTSLDYIAVKMTTAGRITSNGTFGGGNATSSTTVNDNKVHHVVVSRSSGADTIYVDGVDVTMSGTFGSVWATPSGTFIGSSPLAAVGDSAEEPYAGFLDEVVFWDGALSSSDAADHYQAGVNPWDGHTSGERAQAILDTIGWPSSLVDLDDGESVFGPATLGGKALSALQLVEATEAGRLFMTAEGVVRLIGRAALIGDSPDATFGDGGGSELPYHDIQIESGNIATIRNVGRCSRQGGNEQIYTDDTSAATYGDADISLSGLLMRADAEALDRAQHEVLLRKDPRDIVKSVTITPGRSGQALYRKILTYELGQRLQFKRRPQGLGSAITLDARIGQIRHSGSATDTYWTTVYTTEPVDPNEDDWAIVGAGVVGTNLAAY